jgi:hypothetical protein
LDTVTARDGYNDASQSEAILPDSDFSGMTWWNGLSETDRRYWCLAAMTAVPAEAWKYFRLVTAPRKSVRVSGGG